MALRKICIRSATGFSLIEILVVLSIITAVAGFSAFMTVSDYRAVSFRNDRDLIVNALQKAREESIHGSCFGSGCTGPVAHGVHIGPGAYTVFQGNVYTPDDPINEAAEHSGSATVSGFTDVVFEALSGRAAVNPGNILTITDASGRTSVITVGSEGRISWTN